MTPSFVLKALCVGWLSGVAMGLYAFQGSADALRVEVLLMGFGLLIPIGFWLCTRWRMPRVEGLLLMLLGAAAGVFLVGASFPTVDSVAYKVGEQPYEISGRIQGVDYGERQQVTLTQVEVDGEAVRDRVILFLPAIPEYRIGAELSATCLLEAPEPFDGFAYDRFLASKGVFALCFKPTRVEVEESKRFQVASLRYLVIDGAEQLLGEPHSALLAGLLIGEKRFSQAWEDRFVATGTSHIVAASGYNVTILAYVAFTALVAIGLYRKQAVLLVMLVLVAYVFISGGDPPVTRAGIMGSIVIFSKFLGRSGSVTNILLLTASIMLALSPGLLRYDVGFQLSFLSTIGLIYLSPTLERFFTFVPESFTLRESVTATVTATLATLPVILSQFGVFSLAAVPVNLLILPLVPYTMAFGAIAVSLSYIVEPLAQIAIAPTWLALEYMLLIIESVASIPGIALNPSIGWITQGILWALFLLWLNYATKPSRFLRSSR
jgi:competence protein ComEC